MTSNMFVSYSMFAKIIDLSSRVPWELSQRLFVTTRSSGICGDAAVRAVTAALSAFALQGLELLLCRLYEAAQVRLVLDFPGAVVFIGARSRST